VTAGRIRNGGVFEDVLEVLGNHVVGLLAADVLGGEGVPDLVARLGGLSGGVDVLGEVNGGFVLGEGSRYGVNGNGVATGRGYGGGFAAIAVDLEVGGEFAGILVGVLDAASGFVHELGVAEVEDVVVDSVAGSRAGAGEPDGERDSATIGIGFELNTSERSGLGCGCGRWCGHGCWFGWGQGGGLRRQRFEN